VVEVLVVVGEVVVDDVVVVVSAVQKTNKIRVHRISHKYKLVCSIA